MSITENLSRNIGGYFEQQAANLNIVQELLDASQDDASALFPEILYQNIIEEAERERTGRQFCDVWQIRSRTTRIVHASGVLHMQEVPETATIPVETQNYYDEEVTVIKYGVRPLITNEMIEDSEWPLISRHTRLTGQSAGRKEDDLFYTVITDTSNVTDVAEKSDGYLWLPWDILSLMRDIRVSHYRADTLLMHPVNLYDELLTSDWITDASRLTGDMYPGVRLTGQVGRLLGLDLIDNSGMKEDHMVCMDRTIKPIILVVRREPTTKQYEDVIHDMSGFAVTMRLVHNVVIPSGITIHDNIS